MKRSVFGRGREKEQSKSSQTPGKGESHSREEAEFCLIFSESFHSGAAKLRKPGAKRQGGNDTDHDGSCGVEFFS